VNIHKSSSRASQPHSVARWQEFETLFEKGTSDISLQNTNLFKNFLSSLLFPFRILENNCLFLRNTKNRENVWLSDSTMTKYCKWPHVWESNLRETISIRVFWKSQKTNLVRINIYIYIYIYIMLLIEWIFILSRIICHTAEELMLENLISNELKC
jgi:hypothetical protein